MGAKDRIREFFEKNVGKVVDTSQIRQIAGINDYARRIRELRDEEGYQIESHIDRADLKPGQYILKSLKKKPANARMISPQLRSEILERDGYTCQSCGLGPGEPDPCNPSRLVRLTIDHITPVSQGGKNDKANLRVLCSACNQGRANIKSPSENVKNVLSRIRKLSNDDQKEILDFLKNKFESPKEKKTLF